MDEKRKKIEAFSIDTKKKYGNGNGYLFGMGSLRMLLYASNGKNSRC